jgi:single-strand DNA-binding protein
MGRLVKDPEVRVTPNGKTACTFTLAVDRPFAAKNGQKEADFINIVTWGKTAEVCGNHLNKGQRTLLEGRLQIRSYDGKDGEKHYTTEVIANRVEFIERKGTGNPSNSDPQQTGNRAAAQPQGFESMGDVVSENQFDEIISF